MLKRDRDSNRGGEDTREKRTLLRQGMATETEEEAHERKRLLAERNRISRAAAKSRADAAEADLVPDEELEYASALFSGGAATKEVSVVVGTFAMAQKIENGLRDLCSARGITFDNQYEGRNIKSYINPSTLLEYTIHVWRAGEGLRIGIDGDASYEYKKQVP